MMGGYIDIRLTQVKGKKTAIGFFVCCGTHLRDIQLQLLLKSRTFSRHSLSASSLLFGFGAERNPQKECTAKEISVTQIDFFPLAFMWLIFQMKNAICPMEKAGTRLCLANIVLVRSQGFAFRASFGGRLRGREGGLLHSSAARQGAN